MNNQKVGILIPIDVLLDTRIATIAKIDEQKALDLLNQGYHERRSDFFPGIDKTRFEEEYQKRDTSTLARAQCTNAVLFLKELVLTLTKQAVNTPFLSSVEVTINLHPYTLEESVIKGLVTAVSFWIDSLAIVKCASISNEDLTPNLISESFDILFMYEYASWLELQTKNFETKPIPSVNLYVPAISFTSELTEAIVQKVKEDTKMHPLEATKFLLAPFINLEPLDAKLFSVLSPPKFKTA